MKIDDSITNESITVEIKGFWNRLTAIWILLIGHRVGVPVDHEQLSLSPKLSKIIYDEFVKYTKGDEQL